MVVAALRGHVELLRLLLTVNTVDPGAPRCRPWISPLVAACDSGHVAAAQLLLSARASVDLPFPDGELPIFAPAREGHAGVVQVLLEARAAVAGVYLSHPSFTPLYLAAASGHVETVRLLLAARAFPHRIPGRTPLYTAAMHGHDEVVEVLLAAGMLDSGAAAVADASGHVTVTNILRSRLHRPPNLQ